MAKHDNGAGIVMPHWGGQEKHSSLQKETMQVKGQHVSIRNLSAEECIAGSTNIIYQRSKGDRFKWENWKR